MSIILFDSGRSYVVTSIEEKPEEYRFTDSLGRTQKDRDFLDRFESIFYAAASGDLARCQTIVKEGYCDFNAYSIGKFGGANGENLDYVTPLKIAEINKHQKIVDFFKSQMPSSAPTASEVMDFENMSPEDKNIYQDHIKMMTFMKIEEENEWIITNIAGSYTLEELEEHLSEVKNLQTRKQQLEYLKNRCSQTFNGRDGHRKKIQMIALYNYLNK